MIRRLLLGLAVSCLLATACAASPVITPTQGAAGQASASDTSGDSDAAQVAEEPVEMVAAAAPDISRDQAITQLVDVAFLSYSDASCVIDALHDEVGVYDFTSSIASTQVHQGDLIETCIAGGTPAAADEDAAKGDEPESDEPESAVRIEATTASSQQEVSADEAGAVDPAVTNDEEGESVDDDPDADTAQTETETETGSTAAAEPAPQTPAQPPALAPGSITTGGVQLAGTSLSYSVIAPRGFEVGDTAPVAIMLPDDGSTIEETSEFIGALLAEAATARGWVVVSPALPSRDWVDQQNGPLIAELSQWIQTWVSVEGGAPHLGGFGGGGTGAFALAAQNPSAFRSLTAAPGTPPRPFDAVVSQLAQLPVRMVLIDHESNTRTGSMIAADAALRAAGGNVKLTAITVDEYINQGGDPAIGRMIMDDLQALR